MTLPVGTQLGSLHVERQIGAGGMGEVYLARDSDLNRTVAVKVLPADVTADAPRVARFEQEARAASALNHPNVCVIHALGRTADGRRYIAMEHVEGETLRERVLRGRLPLREALDIAIQIASALTAAHAAGIVHRDLKPENVMIRRDRLVKVLDFGLAKLVPHDAAHEATRTMAVTEPGSLVGTVGYMSPEQARGGADVDARTDVWALGVVLYEMITGRPPFTGPSRSDVLVAILDREPAPLAELQPATPPELPRIVRKALRKERDERYQVMKDLLLDLEVLRDDVSSASVSRSADATVAPAVKGGRRRWTTGAVTLIVFIAAALAGVGWWMRRPVPPPAVTPSAPVDRPLRRITFDPGLQTDAAFSPDGRSIAYASDRSGTFDIWVQSLDGGEPRQVTRSSTHERQPSWSPDGKSLAYRAEGDPDGLFVVPVGGGGVPRHLASFGMYPQWSPDGSDVIFRSGIADLIGDVYSVSPEGAEAPRKLGGGFLDGGAWHWIAPHPDGRISAVGIHAKRRFGFFTVSRDGRQVMTSRPRDDFPLPFWNDGATRLVRFQWDRSGTVLFVEAALNDVRNVWKVRVDPASLEWLAAERLTVGAGPDTAAALSPDGSRVAFTTQRESIRLWSFSFDAAAGRIDAAGTPISPEGGQVEGSSLSPDGRRIAYVLRQAGSDQPMTWLTDLDAGTSESLGRFFSQVAWARDNRTIAYAFPRPDRPPPGEWALATREIGGAERIVTGWSGKSVLLPHDWTPDGRAVLGVYIEPLYTGLAKAVVRPVSPPGPDRVLLQHPGRVIWQPSFSPDGRWVSFLSQPADDVTRIEMAVAPAGGAPRDRWVRIAPGHRWVDKPRWAPDGRTLYFIASGRATFLNLWGVRFDSTRGQPVGGPFQVTQFDSPGFVIGPNIASAALGIAASRAVLQMATITGNIWLLEGVDK